VSDASVASLKMLPSKGNGTFDSPITLWTGTGPEPIEIAGIVDVNGDSKLDIVGTRRSSTQSASQSRLMVLASSSAMDVQRRCNTSFARRPRPRPRVTPALPHVRTPT
jgi:hypothetical protein